MNTKRFILAVFCLCCIMGISSEISAKEYCQKEYGLPEENFAPYQQKQKAVSTLRFSSCETKTVKTVSVKDFNQDGKKETMQIITKPVNKGEFFDVTIMINNRKAVSKRTNGGTYFLDVYHLHGGTVLAMSWGYDAKSDAIVCEWKENKFRVIRQLSRLFVGFGSAKDKNDFFYVKHQKQYTCYDTEKCPQNIMKRYKKYIKRVGTSATRITYEKYAYRKGKLKKIGTDHYYFASGGYE
mgnify:FL=1